MTDSAAAEDSGEAASDHDFIELKSMQDVEACDQRQLYQYIEKLHGIIRKYDTRLAANKQKLKQLSNETKLCPTTTKSNTNLEERESPAKHDTNKKDPVTEYSATDAFSFVDEMRQAAKHAENLNNFVYEPTSGMYYDPKTGYYYNAEYDLYYDGNTGCYYSYDHGKDSYEFHSQAQVQANDAAKPGSEPNDDEDDEVEFDELGGVITDTATLQKIKTEKQKLKERAEKSKRRAKKKKEKSKKHNKSKRKKERISKPKKKRRNADDDRVAEDGELQSSDSSTSSNSSENDSSSSGSEDDGGVPVFKAAGRFQDIAKKYPPSLRIIVQETNVEELVVGSLHLITYKGGSLGREGEHDVIIPDVNVSKSHLEFFYEAKTGIYRCRDLGSRNGTVLNGMRMASEPMDLVHGSVVTIGQTRLLCHVHEGNSTCGLCEPGLLIETQAPVAATALSSTAMVLTHKEQLKKLQKKYGLENEKFVEASGNGQHKPNYNDRAATRRVNVGSSTDKEKTEVACVHTEIASSNKGFKMLSKLGWQRGNTLGKTNASAGLLTPINVVANEGTSGLGRSETTGVPRPVEKRKIANLKITQARYQRANDIFEQSDESD
ncbi:angiogenic factor with G patch and FHA domains 1 isoform X1 [Drosophila guanche]|uniref:Blast:Angiogenic factor with G patch and FHA domains 1 n=1 Tax=Drosophila guanche TaxID=7266 RepID=A0A3B0J3M7_DROGU|nr:angiogenic factor with G patch and FHA domains 1 isoform X1 [Drosophila guanche]SPP75915.1 blast:Angiogenic factor with G patch and FHA domains 1 [Drosophila guanche]